MGQMMSWRCTKCNTHLRTGSNLYVEKKAKIIFHDMIFKKEKCDGELNPMIAFKVKGERKLEFHNTAPYAKLLGDIEARLPLADLNEIDQLEDDFIRWLSTGE